MKRVLKLILAGLVVFMVGCTNEIEGPADSFVVSFINIGKGDAFLFDVPGDGYYLCDTGKTEDFARIARLLKIKNVNHLNGIFLSHGHLDHAGNIDSLLKLVDTDAVYISKWDDSSYKRCPIRDIVQANHVELVELEGGEHFDFHDLEVDIWLPKTVDYVNENNNSMVMYLTYGNTHFLMTGDMEEKEELEFIRENKNIRCDVLKLGHHGEKDATSVELLNQVKPKYGIITGNEKENPESVNTKIKDRLDTFRVKTYYSEGKHLALDFSSDKNMISIQKVQNPDIDSDIKFECLNFDERSITLKNDGDQNIDISGYGIRSKKDEQWMYIPEGTILDAGSTITFKTPEHWEYDVKSSLNLYDDLFNKIDKEDWE